MNTVEQHPLHPTMAMPGANDPILQSLERYWQSLRHAQRIPSRNDVASSQIDQALPHAFILQRVAPKVARMRVAGQHLHDLLKMDARGMPVSALFTSDGGDQISELIEASFLNPAIVCVSLCCPKTLVRPKMSGTLLLLPLRDNTGATSRMLGALVTQGTVGARPRRFEVVSDAPIRNELLVHQFANDGLFRAQQKGPDAMRPALRLVVNNG